MIHQKEKQEKILCFEGNALSRAGWRPEMKYISIFQLGGLHKSRS
jgi:hypothetical protein